MGSGAKEGFSEVTSQLRVDSPGEGKDRAFKTASKGVSGGGEDLGGQSGRKADNPKLGEPCLL